MFKIQLNSILSILKNYSKIFSTHTKFHNVHSSIHLEIRFPIRFDWLARNFISISVCVHWLRKIHIYSTLMSVYFPVHGQNCAGNRATVPMPQSMVNLHRPLAFARVRLTIKAARNRLVSTAEKSSFRLPVTKRSLRALRAYTYRFRMHSTWPYAKCTLYYTSANVFTCTRTYTYARAFTGCRRV